MLKAEVGLMSLMVPKMEEGILSQGMHVILSWKRQGNIFCPGISRKEPSPAQGSLFQTSDFQNCDIITLCFFRLLNL